MFIFLAKMIISGAPVFCLSSDRVLVNAVIMQIEVEHGNSNDTTKDLSKGIDIKGMFVYNPVILYNFYSTHVGIDNTFIEHSKRYVDPYHPSVPTPPPNFC